MIARLKGVLVDADGSRCTIDVRDVGYEVVATQKDLQSWKAAGGPVVVHVATDVREDAIVLYGFSDRGDRACFLTLRTVSGVGPKVALAALDALGVQGLSQAVGAGDVKALCRISGVGKKLASRLALELKDKLAPFAPDFDAGPQSTPVQVADPLHLALEKLGYGPAEIARAEAQLKADGIGADEPVAQRLRNALRALSGRR
ncbi:MAG: Holliday junction branch migration protein RuvA [Myxococcota bacterium]